MFFFVQTVYEEVAQTPHRRCIYLPGHPPALENYGLRYVLNADRISKLLCVVEDSAYIHQRYQECLLYYTHCKLDKYAVLLQGNLNVTDRWTNERTTDRQTDDLPWQYRALP